MPNPLLSICIPTNKQAKWLVMSLQLLARQIAELGDKVELNILDDDSMDDTFAVVEKSRQLGPIHYQRHINRQGQQASMMELITRVSKGEFIWILPPTVFMRPGGVKKVVEVLEEHPEVDFVFVNSTNQPSTDCPGLFDILFERDLFNFHYNWFPLIGKHTYDCSIERWETLLEPDLTELFITETECCIPRRKRLLNFQTPKPGKPFSSLFDTYPLAFLLAHTMPGCQAYYLGYPCTVSFVGHQDWVKLQPVLQTVRKQELLDELQIAGVEPELVNRARIDLLKKSVEHLDEIILNPHTPGRKYFDLQAFTARFAGQGGVVDRILDQVDSGLYWREIRLNPVLGLSKMSDFLKNIPYRDWLFNEFMESWKPIPLNERISWIDMLWKQTAWAPLKESLLGEWLKSSQRIAIFNPFKTDFLHQITRKYHAKNFYLIEMIPSDLEKLGSEFSAAANVNCLADQPAEFNLQSIDFAWSLFYNQYLPRTLWLHHMKNVYQMLRPGGKYLFSALEIPDKKADDMIQNAIIGQESYPFGDVTNCAYLIGFKEVELLEVEKIKQGNQQIALRQCLAKK